MNGRSRALTLLGSDGKVAGPSIRCSQPGEVAGLRCLAQELFQHRRHIVILLVHLDFEVLSARGGVMEVT